MRPMPMPPRFPPPDRLRIVADDPDPEAPERPQRLPSPLAMRAAGVALQIAVDELSLGRPVRLGDLDRLRYRLRVAAEVDRTLVDARLDRNATLAACGVILAAVVLAEAVIGWLMVRGATW